MEKRILKIFVLFLVILMLPYFVTIYFTKRFEIGVSKNMENIHILYEYQGNLITMNVETCINGIVAAEMPINFHTEALKAQAVLSRSFVYEKINKLQKKQNRLDFAVDELELPYVNERKIVDAIGKEKSEYYLTSLHKAVAATKGKAIYGAVDAVLPFEVNRIAKSGKNHKEILKYYYPDSTF